MLQDKAYADAFEALIGAHLVGGGFEAAVQFLRYVWSQLRCQLRWCQLIFELQLVSISMRSLDVYLVFKRCVLITFLRLQRSVIIFRFDTVYGQK
jgi:hypothetical protein